MVVGGGKGKGVSVGGGVNSMRGNLESSSLGGYPLSKIPTQSLNRSSALDSLQELGCEVLACLVSLASFFFSSLITRKNEVGSPCDVASSPGHR